MSFWRKFWIIVSATLLGVFIWSIVSVVILRFVPVYYTPLMLKRVVEKKDKDKEKKSTFARKWTPLENISHNAVQAVVASEDNLFMQHSGFDKKAIEEARKYNKSKKDTKPKRGGSTISQQTAKNVFTFGTRTWVRKGVESYFTVLIEWIWGKKRIMEVYLNIVELGNGIYGVEAASQHYFRHSAKTLTAAEAALLAAALPAPLRYSISNPGKYMRKRQQQIVRLMPKVEKVDFDKPRESTTSTKSNKASKSKNKK